MKKILLGVLVITVCFLLVGCGKENKKSPIVGKWAYSSNFVYTFNEDNTCEYDVAGTIMKCTYKVDGENLSILYDGDSAPFETTFEIEENELRIKDSMGSTVTYKKQ